MRKFEGKSGKGQGAGTGWEDAALYGTRVHQIVPPLSLTALPLFSFQMYTSKTAGIFQGDGLVMCLELLCGHSSQTMTDPHLAWQDVPVSLPGQLGGWNGKSRATNDQPTWVKRGHSMVVQLSVWGVDTWFIM